MSLISTSSFLSRYENRNGKFVNFMSLILPTPYFWDSTNHRYVYKSSRFGRRFVFQVFFVLSIGYDLFSLYTCKRAMDNKDVTPFAKVRVYYMSYGYMVMTITNWFFVRDMGRHNGVYNSLLDFVRHFEDLLTSATDKRVASVMFRCHFMHMFLYIFVLSNAVEVFRNPGSYRLLTSLAENPKSLPVGIKLVFFVIHVEINAFKFYSSIFQLGPLIYFMFMAPAILNKLRHNGSETSSPLSRERVPTDRIVADYNKIRLLQTWMGEVQGHWLLTTITYSTVLIILSVYQAIIFTKIRPAVVVLGFGITLAFIVRHCGNVYETSVEVQHSWVLVKAPTWFHKWVRSCQPARIKLGSFFFIDKGLKLTLLDIILNQSINLVVSHNN